MGLVVVGERSPRNKSMELSAVLVNTFSTQEDSPSPFALDRQPWRALSSPTERDEEQPGRKMGLHLPKRPDPLNAFKFKT